DREARPPDHNPRQDAPRADPIAPGPGRYLEQRIGDGERTEGETHLDLRQPEVTPDLTLSSRDADPVQIGQRSQGKSEHQYPIPDMAPRFPFGSKLNHRSRHWAESRVLSELWL